MQTNHSVYMEGGKRGTLWVETDYSERKFVLEAKGPASDLTNYENLICVNNPSYWKRVFLVFL